MPPAILADPWMSRNREDFGEQERGKKIKRETTTTTTADQNGMASRRSHVLLNTLTPCAACKLLRRRCAYECPFSPYFSPHEPHKFAAVHKVFGASNVSKMLLEVGEEQRADAANSLVYEANLRLRDPVYGCMGAISALQHQIQLLQAELFAVRTEILRYKYREAGSNSISNSPNGSSVAALPMGTATPPPPTPPSVVVSSSSSSNSSTTTSLYNTAAAAYGSISTDNNVPYFD